ncbi:MAG: sulfotransferase domain-containing protein [Candidatus Paceibacteria bacterium]
MKLPNFFWIGPQKSASTWAYFCFKEHPDIYVHKKEKLSDIGGDSLHYFDMYYHKGEEWYQQFFEDYSNEKAIGDTTSSYIRSQKAAQRIAKEAPKAKIITCLRNPVDRAYSHYWHEKSKGKINFEFSEVFENYDLFQNWIEPGFYYSNLQNYFDNFDRENILIMFLEDLKQDDHKFIKEVYKFLEVDHSFKPSVLTDKVNTASNERDWKHDLIKQSIGSLEKMGLKKYFTQSSNPVINSLKNIKNKLINKKEYKEGIGPEVRSRLKELYKEETKKLEQIVKKDLSHWYN